MIKVLNSIFLVTMSQSICNFGDLIKITFVWQIIRICCDSINQDALILFDGIPCKSVDCGRDVYKRQVIDGASVDEARQEAGRYLCEEHPVEADVVIGVPDSGIPAAIGYAKYSGIPYGVGLIKNRYIGRTFIQPGQDKRCLLYTSRCV